MASNKIIEDALMKPVCESDVSAIVGSLESHLASATSQPDGGVDVSRGPATITLPATLNHDGMAPRPMIQTLTPASVRARTNGPTIVRATGTTGGSIVHLRQQNPIQLVTMPHANAAVRGRGMTTMIPAGATLQGATLNTASPGNISRQMGPGTVVIGNQLRVAQPSVVQPGQVPMAPGHILVKTSDGNLQLVRLAAPTANQATNAVPVHVPASMASPLGPFRFQANPTPGTIRTTVSAQHPQTLSQPTIVGGSQSIVVRGGVPSSANLPSRSPTPVAVVQPQPQPPNHPQSHFQQSGPPPLIQQNRVIVSGNQPGMVVSQSPRLAVPTSTASSSNPANSNPSGSGQMPPEMAKTKCKNFLATLLRLANDQPPNTARNVRSLIQGLVDGVVVPEDFTTRLQEELNSSPQPCLVPFLKKSLPYLRHALATGEMQIEGVTAPPLSSVTLPSAPGPSTPRNRAPMQTQVRVTTASKAPQRPGMTAVNVRMPSPLLNSHPPGLTPRTSLDGGSVPFNHQTMSLSQFPTALKIMTPTSVHNAQNLPSPQARSPMSSSAPTPPPTTLSGGKSKAKSKAVANGVASPKNQTPKNQKIVNGLKIEGPGTKSKPPAKKAALASNLPAPNAPGAVRKDEVDDINDVAAMGGVNLLEESQRILGSTEFIGTVARSCQDVMTLDSEALVSRVAEICQSKGLDPTTISSEVLMLISHATEEMVKTQLSKLSHAAQHRMDVFKFNPLFEQSQDVRGQIRFLENVEKGEKRRHEEQEREILIRAAKSRAKVEDPERAKLREKAKELQRAEQEEIRQREANLTALQAIGPRKKAKLDGAASTSLGSGPSLASQNSSQGPSSMMSFRPRVKRVNMRDLVFIWENDKDRCRGFDLYKVLLNK